MNDTLSPLVSIIICVYNGEKYLERCLQSAMSQSYKNIEIIVVNDGSMDNTPVIIENYVKLDCRIIVISKQNGGISEARRIGVNRARGKYIQYLDCDDVLMSNAIGCLVNRAEETQADVVVAPFFFCEDGGRKESDSMEFEQMSGIEYLKCILCSRAYWAMWTKFHLRSLYDEGIERLGISFGEDVALSTQILVRSGKVVSINTPILDYYVYSSSVSHDLGERRRMCGRITPGKRLAVILLMFFFFGGLSIYITVSSIYNIGKRDGQRLQIEHIRQLPLHGNDTTKSINPLNRPQYGRSTEE